MSPIESVAGGTVSKTSSDVVHSCAWAGTADLMWAKSTLNIIKHSRTWKVQVASFLFSPLHSSTEGLQSKRKLLPSSGGTGYPPAS